MTYHKEWAEAVWKRIEEKEHAVTQRNVGIIPYTTVDGRFDDRSDTDSISWWTNGFWGGMMWQLYHVSGDSLYKEVAEWTEKKLDAVLMSHKGLDHDNGFKWLPTAVANYRETGSEESYNRGILAAENLLGRFNPAGPFLRAWNDNIFKPDMNLKGVAIIDCMMNLPLLYWAYEQTEDPRFLHVAMAHADMAMERFIRADGSVRHIIEFDPMSGEYLRSHGGQGFAHGSSWTRGQAWGLYGFTLSYMHTKKKDYLRAAQRIAHYFIANTPESKLIPVDFRQPAEPNWEDSTAAAIAACGLIELANCIEGRDGELYLNAAVAMLKVLYEQRCNWDIDCDQLLEKCTAAYHDTAHEFSIIYGDYYFMEAILKLSGKELFIW